MPLWRKVGAFAVLAIGALIVAPRVMRSSRRDVTVSVGMADFREGARKARRIEVTFTRYGEAVLVLQERFSESRAVPARWTREAAIEGGAYESVVEVETEERVSVRRANVEVSGGELRLAAPRD